MKINIQPDKGKAKALRKMAEITLERLKETDIGKYPSNALVDYYDVMHKLMEALILINGIKIKGEGAHQELIDFIARKYNFNDQNKQFLQNMRDYRNRISYEGFMINKNFIILNQKIIVDIINNLKILLKKNLE